MSTDRHRFLINLTLHKELGYLLRLVSHQTNDLCCSNQEIDNISFQRQNPFMLDRGLLEFWSMIDTLQHWHRWFK